ncbi:MarR family winged helix-turn-helix transcriptional regulator [Brevibacterium oceani]|uniref:MarR family winged helix-turn-helix transcriptional regulator n=1 Tax=Brevibacterium oceani TaxID=358099 RepID=UPI001B32DA43|nr:MarR family transcriptional regulator [Brevibacterium oceani]
MSKDEESTEPYDEDLTYLVDAVFRLERATAKIGSLRLAPWKLTLSGYAALRVLDSRPHLSLAQLSRRCFVKPQTMTRIVTNLVKLGYLDRAVSPNNERAMSLTLTDHGRSTLRDMDIEVLKVNDAIAKNLDGIDLSVMVRALRDSARAVEADIQELEQPRM